MRPGRTYNQYCGVARALDLVGERWALLVVRELALGPKRFTDLREGLPGIATNVLSERLRQLERDGVVVRRRLPAPAASQVYELSEYGEELVPIMLALGRWGARTMGERSPAQALRPEWLALALKAFFRPDGAGFDARVRVEVDGTEFTLTFANGALDVHHGAARPVDLSISAKPEDLIAFLSGRPGSLQSEGDEALLARLPSLFSFASPEEASV